MPELPEVETCVQGLIQNLESNTIEKIIVREKRLRWPVQTNLNRYVANQKIETIYRRAKYILFRIGQTHLMLHLGMSGTVRIVDHKVPVQKHDHIDITLNSGQVIRYNDPRRFGSLHLIKEDLDEHFLLKSLGPEPLDTDFNAHYLYQSLSSKKVPIKTALMNNKIVVGVGNIYANEALFLSQIHPLKKSKEISLEQCKTLTKQIKAVLKRAIRMGGTTLKDFSNAEGKPGYFQQTLLVYGREEQPCIQCKKILEGIRLNNRATVYCPQCQELS